MDTGDSPYHHGTETATLLKQLPSKCGVSNNHVGVIWFTTMSLQYDQKKSYNHQPEDTPQVSPDGFAKLGEKLDQNLISPSPPSSEVPLFSFQSCQAPFGADWNRIEWSETQYCQSSPRTHWLPVSWPFMRSLPGCGDKSPQFFFIRSLNVIRDWHSWSPVPGQSNCQRVTT